MKHIIIGTAGHVDHGKTCLTKALTGVDTDRLKEEQRRGITIEIGFAQLTLPNGQTASIIDVPGHEKLIKNMLVGATGIDVVLLVVAADEGFMPQTKEHLEILTMLGVKKGIIVVTKKDMVDEEWLEVVKDDIREHVKGSFLEDAPMIAVSAYTMEGIDELKQMIVELVRDADERPTDRPFRLPVDRVFSIKGFGTVVTGTLVDGKIETGESVEIYPLEKLARVRELQNHDVRQERVSAGMRVAINLGGVEKKELMRGCTIAKPYSMQLTYRIAASIQLTKDSPYSVKNASLVHFYQGTQELVGRVRLLSCNVLKPGQKGYALIMFEEKLTARNLDKFIIRFFSPMTTIGGGVILDMESPRLKRNDPAVLERLDRLSGRPLARIMQMIDDAGCTLIKENELANVSGLSASEVRAAVKELTQSGKVVNISGGLISARRLDDVWQRIEELLRRFHQEQSLADGMNLGELRERIFSSSTRAANAILEHFIKQEKLRFNGSVAALAEFSSGFSSEQTAMHDKLESIYLEAALEPPSNAELQERFRNDLRLFKQVFARMVQDGTLIPLNTGTAVHYSVYKRAYNVMLDMFREGDFITLGNYRTRLGVSRKYAVMYLENFDDKKITKLIGDKRVLLKKQ